MINMISAATVITGVNADVPISIQSSTGYTTLADGTQVPSYTTIAATGNIQALSGKEISHLDGLNIQGVVSKAYLAGNYEGQFRSLGKGGDLLTVSGKTYLVAAVLERWPDWCSLALILQG